MKEPKNQGKNMLPRALSRRILKDEQREIHTRKHEEGCYYERTQQSREKCMWGLWRERSAAGWERLFTFV